MEQSISLPAVMPGEPRNQLSCWRIAREREGGEWGSAPPVSWAKVNSQLGWIAGQLPQPYHSFSFCQKVLMEPLLASTSTANLLDWKMLKQPPDNWLLSERECNCPSLWITYGFLQLWLVFYAPSPHPKNVSLWMNVSNEFFLREVMVLRPVRDYSGCSLLLLS